MENCAITSGYLHRREENGKIILKPPMAGTTAEGLQRVVGVLCERCVLKANCQPEFIGDNVQNYYFIQHRLHEETN